MGKALFWDFDGTLVKSPRLWSTSLLRSLKEAWPGCPLAVDDVRPHMQGIFPWDAPDRDVSRLTGERWWEAMCRRFEKACLALGAPESAAHKAAWGVRSILLLPDNYALYDDSLSVLKRCASLGFTQFIVSNNHPDLNRVLCALGLAPYFKGVVVSGEIGFDKPRREIFEHALELAGHPDLCFMIGDNPVADGEGAHSAHIPPLLVHLKETSPIFPACDTLSEAADLIQEALYAGTRNDHGGL